MDTLQKIFESANTNVLKPSTQDVHFFSSLPELFRDEIDVSNHSFNTLVHQMDDFYQNVPVLSPFLPNCLSSKPDTVHCVNVMTGLENDSTHGIKKLVPFPKSSFSVQKYLVTIKNKGNSHTIC